MTLTEIRRQYPNPISSRDVPSRRGGTYCVGLAVMLAHSWYPHDDTFPGEAELAHFLADLNPALDEVGVELEDTVAYAFATEITTANDTRDFETAWQNVGRALTYEPGKPGPLEL